MLTLYDSPFSPFARKVRLAMDHKGLEAHTVDGLSKQAHADLKSVNGRIEVPVLVDGSLTIVNSADIIAYLDHRYPDKPVLPADPAARVRARAWERAADATVDPILVNISYWLWAHRPDTMPDGLLDAARQDLETVYQALEEELGADDFLCGALSVADLALFPHLTATDFLDVAIDPSRFPKVTDWLKRLRDTAIGKADLERARAYLSALDSHDVERTKLFWRGDRIEWLLARGFHAWFANEMEEDRVMWPGLGLPPSVS